MRLFLANLLWMNFLVAIAAVTALVMVDGCHRTQVAQSEEVVLEYEGLPVAEPDPEPIKEPPVIEDPPAPPAARKLVEYEYRLEYRFSRTRYVTCYTENDPGDPGHGKYANQKYAEVLPLHQRRIRYEHNTTAMCPEDKRYHQELILLPGGEWSHRWRIHIDGVHKDEKGTDTDKGYFSVPRDRMKQSGRMDYLLTQAGKYRDLAERVQNWKSVDRKCDFWEWTVYGVYSDGSKELLK